MKIYKTPVYDLDELARYNLHIHTAFSRCARADMLIDAIAAQAVADGIEMIALTDHYNFPEYDECYLAQIRYLKRQAEKIERKPKILFGAELSNYGVGKQLESAETAAALDYRLYTCNHFQMGFWEHPAERTPRGYAVFQIESIRLLMEAERADCIAHPFMGKFVWTLEAADVTAAITDNELGELSELGRKTHTAWEINTGAVESDPVFYRRLWHIGKEAGTFFHFGTDAHSLEAIDTRSRVEQMKTILLG